MEEELLEEVEDGGALATRLGFSCSHSTQLLEPGFCFLQKANWARQMELGTVPTYFSMFLGGLPSPQTHSYLGISAFENDVLNHVIRRFERRLV